MKIRIFMVLFLFFSVNAFCLTENSPDNLTKEYVVSPNDILEINVYGEPDLSATLRVASDGVINYPLLGNIKVGGLTVRELEKMLVELLGEDYLVMPQVRVFVKEYAKISIMGQVKKPGTYEVKDGLTLTQAIAMAGGFTKTADVSKVKIIRNSDKQKSDIGADLKRIIDKEMPDIELKAGDVIMVEEYGQVSVMGQVRDSGTYQIRGGLTLTQAIAMAGGFTDAADTGKVKIIRNDAEEKANIEVDVQKIIDQEIRDVELKADDTIIVEEQTGRVSVMGQVVRPGVYKLKQNLTVLEAISMAGGFTSTASVDGTKIMRVGEDGRKQIIRLRMSDVIRGTDKSKDVLLQDGDTIVVPESFF
jgi:polysaccharide export outer membrane protein